MLCTSTNIVKQVIENLYAHVHVQCRVENLTCTKKKVHAFVQVCMLKIEHCFKIQDVRGPYADHILIPQGSTGSSRPIFFDIK